jgi:hypothetical protein
MKYTVFISAFRSKFTWEENLERHNSMHADLMAAGYGYANCVGAVEGVFEGQLELSYYVRCEYSEDLEVLLLLASLYEQDCILIVDNDTKEASLVFDDLESPEFIGHFTEVDKEEAQALDHSKIGSRYFIVK